ncbi:MAG TPA: nicotinate-nucleotide adenylyltransferase [Ktedonobacterales bacterium]|nr:nicotinate-nucleotide adenylyltransferase [Ktedonobacterales bacterium]
MRYGILGGTFDPPHLGHLALAQEAHARLGLDRVWFAPAATPPHKRGHEMSSAAVRRAMVELAIAGDERFGLDTVDLDRPGPAYTVETLKLLRARWGDSAWIGFIIGWDMLLSLPTWHEPAATVAQLDAVVAAHRPGYAGQDGEERALADLERRLPGVRARLVILPGPQLDISSTDLRERVAQGLPVRYLTPDPVRAYITSRGLYAGE